MTSVNYINKVSEELKKSKSVAIDSLIEYQQIWSNSRFKLYMSLSEFINCMESLRK